MNLLCSCININIYKKKLNYHNSLLLCLNNLFVYKFLSHFIFCMFEMYVTHKLASKIDEDIDP